MIKYVLFIGLLVGCTTTPVITKAEIERQVASDEQDDCLNLIDEAMEAGVDIPDQCIGGAK